MKTVLDALKLMFGMAVGGVLMLVIPAAAMLLLYIAVRVVRLAWGE